MYIPKLIKRQRRSQMERSEGKKLHKLKCENCVAEFERELFDEDSKQSSWSRLRKLCKPCLRDYQRNFRGKTSEQMRSELTLEQMHCRKLSKKEIEALSKIYTPPREIKEKPLSLLYP